MIPTIDFNELPYERRFAIWQMLHIHKIKPPVYVYWSSNEWTWQVIGHTTLAKARQGGLHKVVNLPTYDTRLSFDYSDLANWWMQSPAQRTPAKLLQLPGGNWVVYIDRSLELWRFGVYVYWEQPLEVMRRNQRFTGRTWLEGICQNLAQAGVDPQPILAEAAERGWPETAIRRAKTLADWTLPIQEPDRGFW